MNRLTGTAILDYRGETRQVQICLNLDENVIEVRHAMPDLAEAMSLVASNDWHTSPVLLTDVRISTPTGVLSKDRIADFFVTAYRPGNHSIYGSNLSRTLSLREKGEGVTEVILHPRSSRVEFAFEPFDSTSPQFELFYCGASCSMPMPQELMLNPGKAVVLGDNDGIGVRGDQPLTDQEELIRLSLGILQGGPITIRSMLEEKTLTINLAAHDGGSLGPLYKKCDDAGALLQGTYNFLAGLSAAEWAQWNRGIYFFLQGLGGTAPLEIRAINLFTFLEIVDKSDTLSKNSLSALLDLTTDEADLLCRTRNRLIHHGEHIGAAVLAAEKLILEFKTPLNNMTFNIHHADEHKTGMSFFFAFAGVLNRLWIRKAAFTGEWNDCSVYGDPTR